VEGGRIVARHLLQLGHERIAFMAGNEDNVESGHRLLGMREVLAAKRMAIPNESVVNANWQTADGTAYALRWLDMEKEKRPTAVVCANDAMALGFMYEVLKNGVQVPGEVSVVGFDDLALSRYAYPGLTTVRQHLSIIGGAAVRAVYDQREQRDNSEKEPVRFTMELMVRGSSGKVPA
jgi:DNA-binding LacI/PurR family transcriptional regulator